MTLRINSGISLAAILTLLLWPISSGGQVLNGGFELPDISSTGVFYPEPQIYYQVYSAGQPGFFGWTVASGDVNIDRPLGHTASEGAQMLDLNGFFPGSIYQDVPATAGQPYFLRFDFSGNPIDGRNRTMQIFIDGSSRGTLSYNPTVEGNSYQFDMKWVSHELTFLATSASSRIQFTSISSGASGPVLDNIAIVPAPEPRAIGTLAAAALVVWAIARRELRRRRFRLYSRAPKNPLNTRFGGCLGNPGDPDRRMKYGSSTFSVGRQQTTR